MEHEMKILKSVDFRSTDELMDLSSMNLDSCSGIYVTSFLQNKLQIFRKIERNKELKEDVYR